MNERIKKLADKIWSLDIEPNPHFQLCLQAFAESIVAECVKQVKAQYEPVFIDTTMMTDTHWAGYVQCGVDSVAGIREHFLELNNEPTN